MNFIMISVIKLARYQNLKKCSLQPITSCCGFHNSSENTQTVVEIPKRIERGPTDILEALARTVKRDPTANPYRFPDDPHFDVNTQTQRRSMALALEAGRKAAWWVVQRNQSLFRHKVASPLIKAFLPPEKVKNNKVTEEALLTAIEETRVSDAIKIYERLQKKNIELKKESKQKLLELCSFYNCLDLDDERLIESKWYMRSENETNFKTWNSDGFAENLFLEMENDPKANCAIIQGRIKYKDVSGGYDLYQKAIVEDIPLTTEVYNCLIGACGSLKQMDVDRWKLIIDFLREMNTKKIPVNIGTLNSALKVVSAFGRAVKTEDSLLLLLTEFKHLGINPSLGSYYYILKHFEARTGKIPNSVMNTIISDLEGKEFEILHESDLLFFPFAMKMCEKLHDPYLGRLLNEILLNGQNYNFIADNLSESKYYKFFFSLIFTVEPIERAMELYGSVVPKIYLPDFPTYEKIIEAVSENGAIEYFPVIWDNIALMESKSLKLFETLSKALVANPPVGNEFKDFYSKVATHIIQALEEAKHRERSTLRWSSELISNLLTLYTRAGDFEKALKIFKEGQKDPIIEIDSVALSEFLELCISKQKTLNALESLEHAYKRGSLSVIEMAKKIKSECVLDDQQAAFVQQAMEL